MKVTVTASLNQRALAGIAAALFFVAGICFGIMAFLTRHAPFYRISVMFLVVSALWTVISAKSKLGLGRVP